MENNGIGFVFDFSVIILLLSWSGHIVDEHWAYSPWGLVIGIILGTLIAFYRVFKTAYKKQ